jgi:hypothetical protein
MNFDEYDADPPAPPLPPPPLDLLAASLSALADDSPAEAPPPPEPVDDDDDDNDDNNNNNAIAPVEPPDEPQVRVQHRFAVDDEEVPPPPPPTSSHVSSVAAPRARSHTVGFGEAPVKARPATVALVTSPIEKEKLLRPRSGTNSANAGANANANASTAAGDVTTSLSEIAGRATVKLFFRNATSGVSKVLPIDVSTTADQLVAQLLKKLATAKIKVPDGDYELQAVSQGFVHQFAGSEMPLALLRRRNALLICCRAEAAARDRVAIAPVAGVVRDEFGRIRPASPPASKSPPPTSKSPDISMQLGRFQGSYQPPPPPPVVARPIAVEKIEMLDDDDDDEDNDDDNNRGDQFDSFPHSNLGAFNSHVARQVSGRRFSNTNDILEASAEQLVSAMAAPTSEEHSISFEDDDMFRSALAAHAAQVVAAAPDDSIPPPPPPDEDDDNVPPPPPMLEPGDRGNSGGVARRVALVRELVDTERTYVRSLSFLQQAYLIPLASEDLMSADEIKLVFSNLPLLLAVHKELLGDLGGRFYAVTNESPCVGDIFAHLAPYLKLYAQYFRDFDRADTELKRITQSRSRVAAFCNKVKDDPRSRGLDLVSYLIMPVQRLPRYVLLLEQLVEATPVGHADHAPLTTALRQMRMIVQAADASVPPPPLTEAGKALAALGPSFAELNSASLVLCDYAQRWRDGARKGGGTVRLWLLEAWLVVAPARGVVVQGGDGKPLESSNRRQSASISSDNRPQQFSDLAKVTGDTPSGLADAVRVPLSLLWCKRITWSDGLFELLSPVPEHCFLLEMPTRDRERWLGKLLAATSEQTLKPQQRAERSRINPPKQVYVNQIHWESAHELPVDPRTRKENVMSNEEALKYKAMMKKRYEEQQSESLALATKRRDEATAKQQSPQPKQQQQRQQQQQPQQQQQQPPHASPNAPEGGKPKRPKVCQRCGKGKVYARVRVVHQEELVFVCEPCAHELAATRRTKVSRKGIGAEPVPPPPPPEE